MQVLIVRHAPAEDREEFQRRAGLDDSLRPLTAQGRAKMRKNAKGLCMLLPRLELIATSPYQRALETGEILQQYYPKARRVETSLLEPEVRPEALCEWLKKQARYDRLALVGHEPDLSELAGWLLSGQVQSFAHFKKGAACLLEFEEDIGPASARLEWMLTPRQLRNLSSLPL